MRSRQGIFLRELFWELRLATHSKLNLANLAPRLFLLRDEKLFRWLGLVYGGWSIHSSHDILQHPVSLRNRFSSSAGSEASLVITPSLLQRQVSACWGASKLDIAPAICIFKINPIDRFSLEAPLIVVPMKLFLRTNYADA